MEKKIFSEKFIKTWCAEKNKLMLCLYGSVGVILGSITAAFYESDFVSKATAEAYFSAAPENMWKPTVISVVYILLLFAFGAAGKLRIAVYPAVCVRCMGYGTLVCGIFKTCGKLGLCFGTLAVAPYAAAGSAILIYAGEYALGMREAFGKKAAPKNLLVRHSIKMLVIYILLTVITCGMQFLACRLFGKYLV